MSTNQQQQPKLPPPPPAKRAKKAHKDVDMASFDVEMAKAELALVTARSAAAGAVRLIDDVKRRSNTQTPPLGDRVSYTLVKHLRGIVNGDDGNEFMDVFVDELACSKSPFLKRLVAAIDTIDPLAGRDISAQWPLVLLFTNRLKTTPEINDACCALAGLADFLDRRDEELTRDHWTTNTTPLVEALARAASQDVESVDDDDVADDNDDAPPANQ